MSDYREQLAAMRRIHPRLPTSDVMERTIVDAWLAKHPGNDVYRVLDAGCGFRYGLIQHYRGRLWSVGFDADLATVEKNTDLNARAVADCSRIPLQSNSVDLIFCRFVLEHLSDPPAAFREFARVLRPGGTVVMTTVNSWNPAMWSVRLVPAWLRTLVRAASFGKEVGENAPTFYRANTEDQIRSLVAAQGLADVRFEYFPTFMWYWRFATPLLALFALTNRLLDDLRLTRLYGGILVAATKPEGPAR